MPPLARRGGDGLWPTRQVVVVCCRPPQLPRFDGVGALTSAAAELLGPVWRRVGASGPAWRRGARRAIGVCAVIN